MSNSSSFVAPYPPEQQVEAKAMVGALVSDLKMRGITAAVADAYDTVLAILDEEDLWEPLRLEAGTPNYVGAVALATAIGFIESVGRCEIAEYEDALTAYAVETLGRVPHLSIIGAPLHRAGCVSFTIKNVHPFDLCTFVDKMGVALRSGHNCAQPVLENYGLATVARLSVAAYNTFDEIDHAAECIERAANLLVQ